MIMSTTAQAILQLNLNINKISLALNKMTVHSYRVRMSNNTKVPSCMVILKVFIKFPAYSLPLVLGLDR